MLGWAKKTRYITMTEFNEKLREVFKYKKIRFDKPPVWGLDRYVAYLDICVSTAKVTYADSDGWCSYIVKLDADEDAELDQYISGADVNRIVSRYYKVPKRSTEFSASPLLYFNPKYNDTRNYAYYYDINSAYANILANYRFPDTSVDPQRKVVEADEIGFDLDGNLVHEGDMANYVFPLMESPFKKFAHVWYMRKKLARTHAEKQKAKNVLCYCVGYWQHTNPFLRAFVVNSCNELIRHYMSDDTLYCNTDCIVSLTPIPELVIGDNLGEWKYKEGDFAYVDGAYQFNLETPSWKGIPHGWWKNHPNFDILKDEPPHYGNIWEFDKKTFQFKKTLFS